MKERRFGSLLLRVEEGNPREFACVPEQMHGNQIVSSLQLQAAHLQADGVFIGGGMPTGGIVTADCLPLVLFGEKEALLLHISRKTLVAGILDSAKQYLKDFSVTDIYIGPHICPQHLSYKGQGPEIMRFAELFPTAIKKQTSGWSLSLRDAVRGFLNELGVSKIRIQEDGRCTFETPDLPSYRRRLAQGSIGELGRIITTVA